MYTEAQKTKLLKEYLKIKYGEKIYKLARKYVKTILIKPPEAYSKKGWLWVDGDPFHVYTPIAFEQAIMYLITNDNTLIALGLTSEDPFTRFVIGPARQQFQNTLDKC